MLEHLLPPEHTAASIAATAGQDEVGVGSGGSAITAAVLRAMGTTLSQIENAPLLLNSLVLSHSFANPEELLQKLTVHYRGQVRPLRSAYLWTVLCLFVFCSRRWACFVVKPPLAFG